jgi:hypothetical protein
MSSERSMFDRLFDKILGTTKISFVVVDYKAVLNLDVSDGQDYVCRNVGGNCVVNILNSKDGDSGVIELIVTGAGGYTITVGSMFNKALASTIDGTAGKDNFISWQRIGNDIVYSVSTVE